MTLDSIHIQAIVKLVIGIMYGVFDYTPSTLQDLLPWLIFSNQLSSHEIFIRKASNIPTVLRLQERPSVEWVTFFFLIKIQCHYHLKARLDHSHKILYTHFAFL